MRKIIILVAAIFLMSVVCFTVSAETVTDPTGDVAHWRQDQTTWGWDINVDTKPNIDIIELSQTSTSDSIIINMKVAGSIQTSELYSYSAWFNTSDAYYMFYWTNGEGGGLAMNTAGGFNMSQANVTVSGDTITATFTLVGDDLSVQNFWGYAWEYTNIENGQTAEWWGDWIPNEEAPFYGQEQDTDDQDQGTDDTADTTDNGQSTDDTSSNGTPGFEILFFIVAIGAAFVLIKRKR